MAGEITVRARSLVTREATPLLPIENPPGLELLVSRGAGKELSEDIDVALAGNRYAFGFDFVEPRDVPEFVDSLFRVSLYRNTLLVDSFTFAPDDDVAYFVGVWSDEPFNRVEIRETTGTNENEYYGHFYTGANAPDDSDPSVFDQLAKLLADDGGPEDYLGGAVALDGDTAIIAAVGERNNTGAAYVFVRQGAGWVQQAKLLADDGDPDDDFGGSVALDGDTAIIGAIGDDDNGRIAGAAYVFVRQRVPWRTKT